MIITTIIERILMAVSGILMIGYILVDLYVKKAMAECSKKFRYDFAFRYSLLRTGCIFGIMGAIAFTWNFSDYWEGIPLPLLVLHGIFNLAVLMALIVICGSVAKLNESYENEKFVDEVGQANEQGHTVISGEQVYKEPTEKEKNSNEKYTG